MHIRLFSPDANEGGSSSPDANPTAAPSTAPDAPKVESVKDFAELALDALNLQPKAEVAEDKPADSSPVATDQETAAAAPGDINKLNTTDEKPLQATSDQAKPTTEDFTDLPFHKHERFQTLVKERNEFKASLESAKPLIERQTVTEQFLAANRITLDQFKQAMEIQALINTAPEAALERLQPLITHLEAFKGLVLPEDLKTEVDSGALPLARAQEIAKLRKQSQFKEQQSQATARETEAERLMTALSTWEDSVKRTDPDYERKKNFVLNRFVALSANGQWRTPNDAIALAKRAYDEVNAELGTFVPKPKPTKSPPVNGHSSAAKPTFTSWNQAEEFATELIRSGRRH